MPDSETSKAGFSRGRRWAATLNLAIASVALLAVLVMVNYLAQGHFRRIPVANATRFKLSEQTRSVLAALTNNVRITIFYQRQAEVYAMVASLLQEYQNANPRHIDVKSIDYDRSPSEARKLLTRLQLGPNQKDFVSFECADTGQHQICWDGKLSGYDLSNIAKTHEVRRNSFLGELYFTSAIFAVSHPSNLKAYFLTGHGERDPTTVGNFASYSKLAAILRDELSCPWTNLALSETDSIPADCSVLIVASGGECRNNLSLGERSHIQSYLQHNGRLLALLDVTEGLETVLSNWDIVLDTSYHVWDRDPRFSFDKGEFRVNPALDSNSGTVHPIMLPLVRDGFYLRMYAPHPIFPIFAGHPDPGAATFTAVAGTTNGVPYLPSEITPANAAPRTYTLVAAVEKNVVTEHDGTRIVVAGDSDFLGDQRIDSSSGANHYFAALALDWLLQRPSVVTSSISPRPIREYDISLTELQSTQVRWLFLGAMPGSVLFLGSLVWLRRRK